MDTTTSDIRAVEFTPSRDGDSPVLPDLLEQIPEDEQIGTVTADGAYDTRRCHAAIIARDAEAIIPVAGMGDCGKRMVLLPRLETRYCVLHNASAGLFGSDGEAIMSEVAWRPRCDASRRSANA